MGSQVRVLYRAPSKNLGITMVPRFFLCLFLEEKSLSACGILGYFRAISGLLVAKVLQIFSALYPLCHKGLRDFCGYHCCKFLKPAPSEMLHALSRWFVFPALTIIMRVNTQGHIHSTVASKILHLFDVQSSFKQSCDISVSQNMCCQMLIR